MGLENEEMLIALNDSAKALQQCLDQHCCLVADILEGQAGGCNRPQSVNVCAAQPRLPALEQALKEAITVLEESRRAFKSKRLEALRLKLTRVLIETA